MCTGKTGSTIMEARKIWLGEINALDRKEVKNSLICKYLVKLTEKVTEATIKSAEKSIPRKETRKHKSGCPW